MKTKIEIIEETVEYYKTHPRGLDEDQINCVYINAISGDRCAVGRCLQDVALFIMVRGQTSIRPVDASVLEEQLKEEYKGHDPEFWRDLQTLHDCNSYWESNETGGYNLTDHGLYKLEELKELYN